MPKRTGREFDAWRTVGRGLFGQREETEEKAAFVPSIKELPARLRGSAAAQGVRWLGWALAAVHGSHGPGPLAHLVGHHGLHLFFAGGAVVVYFCYLVAHIRRNGWPSFSCSPMTLLAWCP